MTETGSPEELGPAEAGREWRVARDLPLIRRQRQGHPASLKEQIHVHILLDGVDLIVLPRSEGDRWDTVLDQPVRIQAAVADAQHRLEADAPGGGGPRSEPPGQSSFNREGV